MHSISVMLSDDLAGDAKRRVPFPCRRRVNAQHFLHTLRQFGR